MSIIGIVATFSVALPFGIARDSDCTPKDVSCSMSSGTSGFGMVQKHRSVESATVWEHHKGTNQLAPPANSMNASTLFSEDFENLPEGGSWCWYPKPWCQYLNVSAFDDGQSLRVAYHPTSRGSDRLQQKKRLPAGIKQATLAFDVFFERDFEWVKGGKLGFGLFGGKGTTGCKPIVADGWSNRLMWMRNGELILYLYHQNRTRRCGDKVYAKIGSEKFRFDLEVWYTVSISMTLNDPPNEANGDVSLYINGGLVAHAGNLQWRGTDSAFIDQVGLSTFYGGSSSSWAPSKTTHVRYDNILVTPIATIATTPAPTSPAAPTCAKKWKKCGGKTWTGPICCADGLTCVRKSKWYSQCRPST